MWDHLKGRVQKAEVGLRQQVALRRSREAVSGDIERECRRAGVTVQELRSGSRRRPISQVRARLARQLVAERGVALAEAARQLGVTTAATCLALQRAKVSLT